MAQTRDFASLTQSVLQRIRKDIVSGVLPPGGVIRDNNLAARYGVSTSPIREALVRLAAERLIIMPPNKPKRVSPLDAPTARSLFAVYRVVALAGFSWGAPKVGSAQLVRMQLALTAMDLALDGGDRYEMALALRAFFLPVYEASENPELVDLLTERLNAVDRLVIAVDVHRKARFVADCQRVLACFLAGDFAQATQIHFELVERSESEIARFPFENVSRLITPNPGATR